MEAEVLITKVELAELEAREEVRFAQKVKQKWLLDGDQNSRFFHSTVHQG